MKIKLLILLTCCGYTAFAQKPCGNPRIDREAMARAEATPGTARAVNNMIRVYFHILKNDNGSNPAASLQEVQLEFQQLQTDFAPNNICFAYMGVDSINSTLLNNSLDSDNPTMVNILASFNVPNCINIYYMWQLPGVGGSAFQIPSNFCAVARGSLVADGLRVVSHEVGHCLGLLHTFETSQGLENINGSNCITAGDRVCDTPADPYSYLGQPCFSSNMCAYTGFCPDLNGATNYTPPYNNIMNYWGNNGCTITSFTSGQYSRINSFLSSSNLLIPTLSPYNLDYGPVTMNAGSIMQSAANVLNTTGVVQLAGSIRASLQARLVRAGPGFSARPMSGKIVMKPAECNW
ncbi:MAG: hypothetical protein EOO13_11150 [Chitinophagaceae bacterium]|nr:MAG: hypothetical protein EOO13_11150 [Chitinophagaceae bacterium]